MVKNRATVDCTNDNASTAASGELVVAIALARAEFGFDGIIVVAIRFVNP